MSNNSFSGALAVIIKLAVSNDINVQDAWESQQGVGQHQPDPGAQPGLRPGVGIGLGHLQEVLRLIPLESD